jgi:predicted nuclease with RNAse H fold
MKIVGLDLAGKDTNPTGFCCIDHGKVSTKTLLSDRQILNEIDDIKPDLIAVDAPFDFPKQGYFRESDILLKKRGFKPLSPMFPGMRVLVERAKMLVKILRDRGYKVVEVFPRATEEILGFKKDEKANEHEYDALLCAVAGKNYLNQNFEDLDGIIIPK